MEDNWFIRLTIFLVLLLCDGINSEDLSLCERKWIPKKSGYVYKVDCSNHEFTSLPANLPSQTSYLYMNGNRLKSINSTAFEKLSILHTVDLSGNAIVYLDEDLFIGTTELKTLNLSGNRLVCDWRIWWLVRFSKTIENFKGECFSPRALRGRDITTLTEEELTVDCLSVKKLTGAKKDGEYEMQVFGNDNSVSKVFIYCNAMDTDEPSEYLALRAGSPDSNYVKIELDEDCNYSDELRDKYDESEKTAWFTYVKIDLRYLILLLNDTTMREDPVTSMLQYAIPTLCDGSECVNGKASVDLRGTHFKLKKGKQTALFECKQKCGTCRYQEYLQLDLTNPKKQPYSACTLPLGMQSKKIPDTNITASSEVGKLYKPHFARLASIGSKGWCAFYISNTQYLLIDLGKEMTLSGISTQGHMEEEKWVSSYEILYSSDNEVFTKYLSIEGEKDLKGNSDRNSIVTNWFEPRFTGRYVRLKPVTWSGKICMRVELYGCQSDINSYIIKPVQKDKCLTLGKTPSIMYGEQQFPLIWKKGCAGTDFMFTLHQRKLVHTKTGLCLHINNQYGLMFNKTCHKSSLNLQKVALGTGDAFLIKNWNGKCVNLYKSEQQPNIFAIWRACKNGGFTILSLTRKGVVAFEPIFDEEEVQISTDLFVPLNLTCKARSEPQAIYKWKKEEDTGAEFITKGVIDRHGRSILQIANVTWADRGVYFCNAWNSKGSKSKKYNINVHPIQWFRTKPTNQKAIYGERVQFECGSTGIPRPYVKWITYDESILEYRDLTSTNDAKYRVESNGTLFINNISYTDEKEYFCVSKSPGLIRNVSAKLDVYVTQSFNKTPASQKALYGSDVIFDCVSVGRPKPKLRWRFLRQGVKGFIEITDSMDNKYKILENGTLIVKNAKLDDEGFYQCISRSPGLTNNATASLAVYVTQRFNIEPQDSRILYGTSYTILCESVGSPKPTITWMHQNSTNTNPIHITQNANTNVRQRSDGHLLIINATHENSGLYFCISHSPGLVRNASSRIIVYVTQNFTRRPLSTTVKQGESTIFSCNSIGTPKPHVTWLFKRRWTDNYLIPQEFEDERREIKPNNDFVITNVRDEDEGLYICVSKSPGLVVNASAELQVHIKPVVTLPSANLTYISGQTHQIKCSISGDPHPTVFWFKIVKHEKISIGNAKGDRVHYQKDGVLYFKDLKKSDDGKYMCEAINEAGVDYKTVHVTIYVRCSLNLANGTLTPAKDFYKEKESVQVKCTDGFDLIGPQSLTCNTTGSFGAVLPSCVDVNECEKLGDVVLCGQHGYCVNTVGSYTCRCSEGYLRVGNQCQYYTKENGSSDQKIKELNKLIGHYKNSQITEEVYLERLLNFSKTISNFKHTSWRRDALSKIANHALKLSSSQDTNESSKEIKKVKTFACIMNNILEKRFVAEWKEVNGNTCGSVCAMKYFEEFVIKKAKNINADVIDMGLPNLEMKIVNVNETFKQNFSLTVSNHTLNMPSGNYALMKGSKCIVILYKTLRKLLPKPVMKGFESAELFSEVFSVSFTKIESSQPLAESAQISLLLKKKINEQQKSTCSFWNFTRGKYGEWSDEGCRKIKSSSKEVVCECDHLTNFAILVPKESVAMIYLTFSLVVVVCVGFCIVVAFLTCMSHVCCSQYVKSDRKAILVNVTLTILFGLFIFAGGVYISTLKIVPAEYAMYFCYSLVGTLQLFGCAFFAWMLSEAIQLYFSTRIAINKGNGRLALFYFIGWGIPILIVGATGALVYFDKLDLQSRCITNVPFYLICILVGAPSLLFILATFVVYIMIRVNLASDKELLNVKVITHTKGAMICSFCLILLHVFTLGGATMFLRLNRNYLYHYIFAAVTALEGLFLIIYHCYVDRKASRSDTPLASKNRNSYSTKETVTYSSNGTSSNTEIAEEEGEQKYLIKSSSKRSSKGEQTKPSPPEIRNLQGSEDMDWDASYQTMYGASLSNKNQSSQAETKPLLSGYRSEGGNNEGLDTPSTFRAGSFTKNSTLSRNGTLSRNDTLPRRWNEVEDGKNPLKRCNSKASSIVSVETHTSSNTQHGIPVYFPAAPPHYEMSLDKRDIQNFLESAGESRPTSFGIESDRVSNLSNELSNILYELQAFDTNRPPVSSHNVNNGSQTLPMSRREAPMSDISHHATSTFKPSSRGNSNKNIDKINGYSRKHIENNRGYHTKQIDSHKANQVKQIDNSRAHSKQKDGMRAPSSKKIEEMHPPSYADVQRVRILRGRNRSEADPADGLHTASDTYADSL